MATRARVGVDHDGVIKSIYVHFDGYVMGVGRTLHEHYGMAKAIQLVSLGDVSTLGKEIGEKHTFDPVAQPTPLTQDWTTFYSRDRGEQNCEFLVDHSITGLLHTATACDAEYVYLMSQDGNWYVQTDDYFTLVSEEIFNITRKVI